MPIKTQDRAAWHRTTPLSAGTGKRPQGGPNHPKVTPLAIILLPLLTRPLRSLPASAVWLRPQA
jgi:hypothetical protein